MWARAQALAVGVVVGVGAAASAQASHFGTRAGVPRGRVPAVAIGYATRAALDAALARYPARVVRRLPALHVVEVRPVGGGVSFATRIARLPGIRFAQRATARHAAVLREPALALAFGKTVPWEWQFSVTREDAVPDAVLRAASTITIAIIDTGADVTAPDIAAKDPLAYNERTGTSDIRDTVGHGTFVAALAAGSVTNDDGIAGFGGDAKLMIIKAGAGDGSFTDLDESTAIVYAVDHGAKIINLSLGGPSTSATERRAIDYATSHGALVVAAAGNEFADGNPVEYPAALLQPNGSKGVGGRGLSVGASTMNGTRASFSNSGTYISLVAPGENVFSAVSSYSSPTRFPRVPLAGSVSGLYGYASGTSFSTPEVAGAAALVWAADPLLDAQGVAQILKASASGQGVWSPDLGWGVLDVGAAVQRALGIQATAIATSLTLNGAVLRPRMATGIAVARRVSFVATLSAAAPTVAAGARLLQLERFDGVTWVPAGEAQTTDSGQATWNLTVKSGTLRYRARWSGSGDLAGSVSLPIVLKIA
ncbi:MAG: S8 family peptidase [Gaiellaceae bacterium]